MVVDCVVDWSVFAIASNWCFAIVKTFGGNYIILIIIVVGFVVDLIK